MVASEANLSCSSHQRQAGKAHLIGPCTVHSGTPLVQGGFAGKVGVCLERIHTH